jgi:hypothetical protein
VTFRSLFGDVPVLVRRLLACPCQGQGGAKSFAALELGNDAVAPELAYVMRLANINVAARSSSIGTTLLIIPSRSASTALMKSPM